MQIRLNGLYLSRTAREVGVVRDRGANQFWRWVTTRGYYVTNDGSACRIGQSSLDLVKDVSPSQHDCDAADSMWGVQHG